MNTMAFELDDYIEAGAKLRVEFFKKYRDRIYRVAEKIGEALGRKNVIFLFGNGGSAADAIHIAAEFVNRFLHDRVALPAIALGTNISNLTSIANDSDFEFVFSRELEALAKVGDVAIGISTSGKSKNVNNALEAARKLDLYVIGFSGRDGGDMPQLCHECFVVPSNHTPLIQEVHITLGHAICAIVEEMYIKNKGR